MFYLLVKLAPYATELYNKYYSCNLSDYYYGRVGIIDDVELLTDKKKLYVNTVFSNPESTDYDKMFTINVVLREHVLWLEYGADGIKGVITPFFVKFFEDNKSYIVNDEDWERWNKYITDKSRWIGYY